MVPTSLLLDNYQPLQSQGAALSIGACEVCHATSRGEGAELEDFLEKHGGINPEIPNACSICHTSVPANTSQWPHAFQWKTR